MSAWKFSLNGAFPRIMLTMAVIALLGFAQGCSTFSKKPEANKGKDVNTSAQLVSQAEQAIKSNQTDVAFDLLDKAVQAGYAKDSAEVLKGKALLASGSYDNATKRFDEALRINPGNRDAAVFSGYSAYMGGDFSRAEARLVDLTTKDPKQTYARYLLGSVYNKTGKPDLAVKEFQYVLQNSGETPDVLNNLGISYFILEKYDNARDAFSKALLSGASKRAQNNLALTLCRMQRFEEAFRTFKMSGGEAFAYNNIGCCYIDAGDKQKAMEFFNKSLNTSPTVYKPAHANILRYGGGQKDASVGNATPTVQGFVQSPPAEATGKIEVLRPSTAPPLNGGTTPPAAPTRTPAEAGKQ